MTTSSEIKEKVTDYLSGDYEITDVKSIPSVEDVKFGKYALRVKLCALSIDLRNSTALLFNHQKQTAGKIHKSFLFAVTSAIRNDGGFIRSFNGDSVLAFWPANYKSEITRCVITALKIKWLLNDELYSLFNAYDNLDFGIGIDWGQVYIVRVGLPRDQNNNDLVFIGECVNFAVGISEQAKRPHHVEISTGIYENLKDDAIFGTNEFDRKVNIWETGSIFWKGSTYPTKTTRFQGKF